MPPGLLCLYNVEANPAKANAGHEHYVDIIAIHGIAEDSDSAWIDSKTGVNWLRDLLPQAIPGARILTYGYDASATSFFGSDAALELHRHADSFIQELHTQRRRGRMKERPIIFICHGLGGLLVKKALLVASTKKSDRNEHLLDSFLSTYSILFFGTPHGTTSSRDWYMFERSKRFGRVKLASTSDPNLSGVYGDSQLAELVDRDFSVHAHKYRIFCFWEQKATLLGHEKTVLVNPNSAVSKVSELETFGIDANHSDMVKFGSEKAHGYNVVLDALLRYSSEAAVPIAKEWRKTKIALAQARTFKIADNLSLPVVSSASANSPTFNTRDFFYLPPCASKGFVGRQDALKAIYDDFFPFGRPDARPGCKSYVIYGMGGSGKTELCAKFARIYREEYCAVFTINAEYTSTITGSFRDIGKYGGLEATESAGIHFLTQFKEPWLLIIDNADDPTIDITKLFPHGDHAHILVTTRIKDFRDHGALGSLELRGLPESDALHLLLDRAHIYEPWSTSTIADGNRIAERLGHLAIALIQAGVYIAKTFEKREICGLSEYLKAHAMARIKIRSRSTNNNNNNSGDSILQRTYATFELSRKYFENRDTMMKQDALEILNIVAFYHFQRISVALFLRAIENRSGASNTTYMSMVSKLWIMLTKRFGSPSGFPLFLQRSDITEYDIREAITELRTASLISYEDAGDSFSLHPLIHSWARDSLSTAEQKTWSIRAFNTLMEAIRLGSGVTDEDRMFHSSILPHLDAFFREVGGVSLLGRDTASFFQMQLARFMPPFYLWLVSDQVLHAAKCGFVMADRGYFEKAALHLQVVTNTLLNTLGMHNVKTMQAALGLAGVYWGLGRLDTAIGLQHSVVTAREHMYGPTNELTLQAMDLLGYSYWLHGYHFEALELHEQATEGMIGTLGQEHEQTLTALDHLGTSLGSLYRHEERLQIHQKVLKCRETTLGATHPDTLVTLDHIAVTLLELGRPDEAKPIITNVHRERQRQLGKEHPWTLWSLCNLAKVHTALGEPRIAETMLTWGVAAAERSLSKDHLGVLMGRGELARAYARLGKMDEAETLTVETIALLESSRGRAHPDCVFALYKLGLLYELKGDKRQAIKRYEEALNRADERITSRHPLAKEARSALAKLSGDHGPGEQSAAGQFRGAKHERKTSLKPSSTW